MVTRDFRVGDEPALHQVFLSAIHGVAVRDYTVEQINAWAPVSVDLEAWAQRMRAIAPFVVEHEGKPIAYADVQNSGYIDHFYVSAPFARQGVGSQLMRVAWSTPVVEAKPWVPLRSVGVSQQHYIITSLDLEPSAQRLIE